LAEVFLSSSAFQMFKMSVLLLLIYRRAIMGFTFVEEVRSTDPLRFRMKLWKKEMNINEIMLEGVKGFAGSALAVWVPTLLYSVNSGQFMLLYLLACSEALGSLLGWAMFKTSSKGFPSCVPVTRVAKAAPSASTVELKKAA
jgi:hypothetical protein